MKLSKAERMILINQLSILDILNKNNNNGVSIEALQSGYESEYYNIFNSVNEDISSDVTNLVIDTLEMFRWINHYIINNPTDNDVKNHYYSKFRGFDGNSETEFMAYANFILDKKELFLESSSCERNSHSPKFQNYRSMLNEKSNMHYPLTKTDIDKLLNASKI